MYRYIFWDWNGTIMDDVGVALDAVNQMLRERQYPLITMSRYRELMDTPVIHFYEPLFDLEKYPFEEIAEEFQQLYRLGNPQPYEEIPELLRLFQEQGRHQIILSSSQRQPIQDSLEHLGYQGYFDAVLGADDHFSRSKTERAQKYLQQEQILPEKCVLLGDTVHDYEVAHSMGMDCILLSCGHDDRNRLEKCGCKVCASLQELQWMGCF